jgi:hypothetical protein
MAPPNMTVDTSPSTLQPPKTRGRNRDRYEAEDDCPICIRSRALSAPNLPTRPRTVYTGARLAAANRALAAAALDHADSEPYGLGSPSFDDEGKEVARFRSLQRSVKTPTVSAEASPNPSVASPTTAATPRSRMGSLSLSAPTSPASSQPSSDGEREGGEGGRWKGFLAAPARVGKARDGVETFEFHARFRLVQGERPGTWRYHVTDDWSNAEAKIRATPKLRRIVASAVGRLFTRRSSTGADENNYNRPKNALGIQSAGAQDGNGGSGWDFIKSSRQLPGPTTGSRRSS